MVIHWGVMKTMFVLVVMSVITAWTAPDTGPGHILYDILGVYIPTCAFVQYRHLTRKTNP